MKRTPRETALRMVVAPHITAKTICLVVPLLVVWTSSQAMGVPSTDELSRAFDQWDTQSYLHLATTGYPLTTSNPDTVYLAGFFPGYPLLVHLAMMLIPSALVAGLVISAVSEAVALYYIARMVMAERDAGAARFTIWLFALWPFAFFLTAAYTESTFIACAAASLYHARRGEASRAALAALLACSVRVTGLALIPALAWEIVTRTRLRPTRDWVALAMVPAPILGFCLYMRVHAHDFFAYLAAQSSPSFNHHFSAPWIGFLATLGQVDHTLGAQHTYIYGLEVLFGVLGAVLCAGLWSSVRIPPSIAIYCTAVWLIATSLNIWLSVPRYELAMFPGLILLGDLTRRRLQLRAALIGVSCGLMTFGTTVFISGRWLG